MADCTNHPGVPAVAVRRMPTGNKQPDGTYERAVPLCAECEAKVRSIMGDPPLEMREFPDPPGRPATTSFADLTRLSRHWGNHDVELVVQLEDGTEIPLEYVACYQTKLLLRPTRPLTPLHRRGIWNMPCWNGLSHEQQRRLIEVGNLPFGFTPEGDCPNGAAVEIGYRPDDEAPGPRFYCEPCAEVELDAQVWAAETP